MEDLNKLLDYCHKKIDKYFFKNQIQTLFDDECNFAFDIEACPTDETKEEMYTYSLSFMSCDVQNNVCYNFDDVTECLNTLLSLPCKVVNLYWSGSSEFSYFSLILFNACFITSSFFIPDKELK